MHIDGNMLRWRLHINVGIDFPFGGVNHFPNKRKGAKWVIESSLTQPPAWSKWDSFRSRTASFLVSNIWLWLFNCYNRKLSSKRIPWQRVILSNHSFLSTSYSWCMHHWSSLHLSDNSPTLKSNGRFSIRLIVPHYFPAFRHSTHHVYSNYQTIL